MLSLKTTQAVHNTRCSQQLATRPDSREAPHPGRARRLTLIIRPTIPNRPSGIPGIPNDPSPIFGHSAKPARRSFPANTRQTPSPTASGSIQFLPHNPHNIKENSPRLSVSASKSSSPGHPLHPRIPNDPSPNFGHSPTPGPAKSATHSPLPPPLPLTSYSTLQLRGISKSPRLSGNKIFRTENNGLIDPKFCCLPYERRRLSARVLRVEDLLRANYPLPKSLPNPQTPPPAPPSRPPLELYFPCKLSILGRFGCFG
jgi:hypothetical protein